MKHLTLLLSLLGLLSAAGQATGEGGRPRPLSSLGAQDDTLPVVCYSEHSIGRLVLGVSNDGWFGGGGRADCFTGRQMLGTQFPKGSNKRVGSGGLYVGGILDQDTIIIRPRPTAEPFGGASFRSSVDPTRPWYDATAPHHEFTAVYYDTCSDCLRGSWNQPTTGRPLMVEVTETSMSWGYDYAQDFVLFDYSIKNVGDQRLRGIYIGIYVDADIYWATFPPLTIDPASRDDMAGFLESFPATYLSDNCPPDTNLLNLAWTADNDANFTFPQTEARVTSAVGLRFLRVPRDSLTLSFNWWSDGGYYVTPYDFGPQLRSSYRRLSSGGYGSPTTDEEWYHFLSNGERDYDQPWQATRPSYDPIWVQPPTGNQFLLEGLDPRFLLSTGPFGLYPGQSLQFTTALVAGTHFHRDANIHKYLPYDPVGWYERVRFDQLAKNAVWAEWIYDNPGVDTDSDGYAGEYLLCNLGEDSALLCDTLIDTSAQPDTNYIRCYWAYDIVDTVWTKGDGIPDLKGAYPPVNPSTLRFVNRFGDTVRGLRVYPEVGKIRMVWNGALSENSPDPFSQRYDFEGYRVYIAHDNLESSYSLVDSYDHENYSRWYYDYETRRFPCVARTYTLEELRCLHGDSCGDTTWYPHQFTQSTPLIIPGGGKRDDKVFFFTPMGANRSILGNDPVNALTAIKRVYPYAVKPPHVHPDSVAIYYPDRSDTTYFTPEGFLKYYEYEYTFNGILSTMPYWVNVTALDHGHPELGVEGMESNPAFMPKAVYPLPSSDVIARENLKVFVYPNPYRGDADYRERNYEGRLLNDVIDDRTRLIHFANLPPKCTISIFSLDGDLIRQFTHDVDPVDYLANHDTWDLINRNMQLVVSGLYYWTVEDDSGNTQIGKLVVIF